jgi:glycosyltransferase involved in cell wall biosynthesis
MIDSLDVPLVSIGVASFNNAVYLIETLESIRAQTYSNWEVIIVDDASKDESAKLAADWLNAHPDVRGQLLVNEYNKGVCHTFNRFLEAASGEYISIIGSDDTFLPNKLATQVPLLVASSPNVGVIYSDLSKMDAAGKVFVPSVYDTGQIRPFSGNIWLEMLKTNFVGAMSVLIRRSCIEQIGHFDEALAYEDWDMWLRIARKFEFLYQPIITVLYRVHKSSATSTRLKQMNESSCMLLQKQLGVSIDGDAIIKAHLTRYTETLYFLESTNSRYWLQERWQHQKDLRGFLLLTFSTLGIPPRWVSKVRSLFRESDK